MEGSGTADDCLLTGRGASLADFPVSFGRVAGADGAGVVVEGVNPAEDVCKGLGVPGDCEAGGTKPGYSSCPWPSRTTVAGCPVSCRAVSKRTSPSADWDMVRTVQRPNGVVVGRALASSKQC